VHGHESFKIEFSLVLHSEDHTSWYILIIKAKKVHYLSTLFGKERYIFRTDLLPIIRSLNTLFTVTGICHTSYVVLYI
jgi:hypothetical protein